MNCLTRVTTRIALNCLVLSVITLLLGIHGTLNTQIHIGSPKRSSSESTAIHIGAPVGSESTNTPTTIQPSGQPVTLLWRSSSFQEALGAFKTASSAARQLQRVQIGQQGSQPTYASIGPDTVALYKRALNLFVAVYQDPAITGGTTAANLVVDGASSSNYIVLVINDMLNAFTGNIQELKNSVIRLVASGQPYGAVIATIKQAAATYQAAAQSVAGYVQKNWDALYTPFMQNLQATLFSVYAFVLNTLAQTATATLTDSTIQEASQYYAAAQALWSTELSIPGYVSADDALSKITSALGTLYFAGIQNSFNAMKIEPSTKILADVIGIESPNRILLTQATGYTQAVAELYGTLPELSDLEATTSAMASALTQAGSQLDSALQSASQANTIFDQSALVVQNAVPLLKAGGAAWYADHCDRTARFFTADFYATQAQEQVATFTTTYKQRIKALSQVITTTDTSNHDNLTDFFTALQKLCDTQTTTTSALYQYENAAAFYQGAAAPPDSPLANGALISQAQTQKAHQGTQLSSLTKFATPCAAGAQLMTQALTALFGGTADQLYSSQLAINQALTLFKESDSAYQDLKKSLGANLATKILPFYELFDQQSLEAFVAQYSAHAYRTIAQTTTDTTVAAEYYLAAFSYAAYLTSPVQEAITQALTQFSSILASAQTTLSAAQSQDSDYKNQNTPVDTNLISAWDTALATTLAAYTMSTITQNTVFAQGADLYKQCLQAYLASYAVTQQSSSTVATLLTYRLYLFTQATEALAATSSSTIASTTGSAELLKTVTDSLAKLFTVTQALVQASTANAQPQDNASFQATITAYTALLTAQNGLNTLAVGAQTALQDQMRATPTAPGLKPLIISSGSTNTVYTSSLSTTVLTLALPNSTLALAQTYKAQGDWALNQAISQQESNTSGLTASSCVLPENFNGIAAYAYAQAAQNYQAAGNTQQARQLQELSGQQQVLYGADIIGNALEATAPDSSVFGSLLGDDWPAYAQYFLNPWVLPLPTDGSLANAEALFQNSTSSSTANLIELAAAFYLYRHLQADGQFNAFSSAGYDALQAVQGGSTGSFGDFSSYVQDAQTYKSFLTTAVQAGAVLPDALTVKTSLAYYAPTGRPPALLSCNLPVPALPETTSQPIYPTALMFYTAAYNQYTAFTGTDSRQQQYIQNKLALLKKAITSSYLSEAYSLVIKIAYMLGTNVNTELIALLTADSQEKATLEEQRATFTALTENNSTITSLDDTTNKLVNALKNGVALTQDYYALAITFIDTVASGAEQPAAQAATQANSDGSAQDAWPEARALVGSLYEQQGDNLATALVGDPTADQYQAWLDTVAKYYALAQGSYTQANRADLSEKVQYKIAQLFEKSAQAALTRELYIAALPFINAAQDQYITLASSGSNASDYQQKVILMGLTQLVALFKGATEFFIDWYTTRWSSPLKLDSGATVDSFQALKELQGSFAATEEETDFYTSLKSKLLDALLYYSQLQTEMSNQIKLFGSTVPDAQTVTSSSSTNSTLAPTDPLIAAYMTRTLAVNQSLADYLKQGNVPASSLRTFFEGMLLNGSADQLQELASSDTSSSTFIENLTLTSEWAGMLYDALAALYIQDYTTVSCPPDQTQQCVESQFLDLKDALQAEAQDIIAPAEQYVG